jgi:hypothetical protein
MLNAKVSDRQTLFDIAALHAGEIEACFDLALLNGLSLTELLESGRVIALTDVVDVDVASNLVSRNARPASSDTGLTVWVPGGIDFMQIEYDFIVS